MKPHHLLLSLLLLTACEEPGTFGGPCKPDGTCSTTSLTCDTNPASPHGLQAPRHSSQQPRRRSGVLRQVRRPVPRRDEAVRALRREHQAHGMRVQTVVV